VSNRVCSLDIMINSFVIEPGIGQEGMFIHEVLFSLPPRSGFVQQQVQVDHPPRRFAVSV
jgi:hypothetical protein